MRRREFLAVLGGAAAWPAFAHAQQAGPARRIGLIMSIARHDADSARRIAAFADGMRALGWVEGRNLAIEYRWAAGDIAEMRRYAAELVAMNPDVIVANSTPVVRILKKLTSSVPIVCALVVDPVGNGFVESLARPGGNITGFTYIDAELVGKWTDLLKEVAPSINRATLVFNPKTTPFYYEFARTLTKTRRSIDIVAATVNDAGELDAAIRGLAREPGAGLIIGPDPFTFVHLDKIAALSRELKLPAVSVHRPFLAAGGLMAYGPDTAAAFRQSASYVDRVLRGTKPSELPFQRPTKYELSINLKTAKALDVAIPPTLLALADEVVE